METTLEKPVERKPITEIYKEAMKDAASNPNPEKPVVVPVVEKKPEAAPEIKPAETTQEKPAEPLNKGLLDGLSAIAPPKPKPESTKEDNLAAQRKIIEEKEARIKELESKSQTLPPDYEELKKNYELTRKELSKIKIEATPEFKKKYAEPLTKAISTIERSLLSVKMEDADRMVFKNEFVALVEAPDSPQRTQKLAEMLESVDKLTEKKLISSITDYEAVREQRESELKDPTETYSKYREQEEAVRKQEAEKVSGVIDEVLAAASEKIPFLKKQEGNEQWNTMVDEIQNAARGIWRNPSSVQNQAEAAVMAAMTPKLYQGLTVAYAEIERLSAELKQYTDSSPDTKAGGGSSGGGGTGKVMSAVEAFNLGSGNKS